MGHRVGLQPKSEEIANEAVAEAELAINLDGADSNVLGVAGCAFADVGQPERAVPILKNAIKLNPNNAQAWAALGSAYLLQNMCDDAIDCICHGIEISPLNSRLAIWAALLSLAHFEKRKSGSSIDQRTNRLRK